MTSRAWHRAALAALLLLVSALNQGCSTLGAKSAGDRLDPWEKWNRKVFSFNEGKVMSVTIFMKG